MIKSIEKRKLSAVAAHFVHRFCFAPLPHVTLCIKRGSGVRLVTWHLGIRDLEAFVLTQSVVAVICISSVSSLWSSPILVRTMTHVSNKETKTTEWF